jgi:lysozyme C
LLTLTVLAGCAGQAAVDGAEPAGESQSYLLAGHRLSETEAAALVRDAGFPERMVGTMLCTIKYESNFYERASNRNKNGSVDYGLFQVNSLHLRDPGCPRTAAALYDGATNAQCALSIYKSQGMGAWYGYGKHRTECDRYPAPAEPGPPPPTEGGCYSGTIDEMVDARACVQSTYDEEWYQCKDGAWLVGGAGGAGPAGLCSSIHPQ